MKLPPRHITDIPLLLRHFPPGSRWAVHPSRPNQTPSPRTVISISVINCSPTITWHTDTSTTPRYTTYRTWATRVSHRLAQNT